MKKLIILIIGFLVSQGLQSATRSLSEAQALCENFLVQRGRPGIITETAQMENEEVLLYVFNLAGDGFVVTASDDIYYPVVAYSWLGSYSAAGSNDLQFRFILADQTRRKDYYIKHTDQAAGNRQVWEDMLSGIRPQRTFQQWPMPGTTFTGGWVEAQWTQSGIFNQFCPLDNSGNRSVVGCVATAMSQIMYFHRYIGSPAFSNSDDYYSGWWDPMHIDDDHEERDFPDWNELNELISTADEHFVNGEEITSQDLAALCFASGVSVEMSYSSEGSGANTEDVAWALRNKFDYDTATWNDNYGGSFYTNIANDMKQMKPCEFSIYTPGWNDGHAIVCDGYNSDDYYHLNFGWGATNIGWYYLPGGMPSSYTIIGGAVRNIEGGELPVSVNGSISGPAQMAECHVLFAGEQYCYEAYTESDGSFSIPALKPGWYSVSAVSGRVWYVEEEIYIADNIASLTLEMFNYDSLGGQVLADIETTGSVIVLYENDEQIANTLCDLNGYFSIPDILPGTYLATASLSPDYFGLNSVTVNQQNQFVSIYLNEYPLDHQINWAGQAFETHSLVPLEISCAVKILPEDLSQFENDIFKGVSFIAPVEPAEGSITAQLWQGEELLVEKPVDNFIYGESIEVEFPFYIEIDSELSYFAGYKIDTQTGVIAWRDEGPRVAGKGAWFRVNNWVEMSPSFDFNFCISAKLLGTTVHNTPEENQLTPAGRIISVYPNPFNIEGNRDLVTISFELESPSSADLELFNIKGQKIAEIFSGFKSSGIHQLSWNPVKMSSGIYFYKLTTENSSHYLKTIIIQ